MSGKRRTRGGLKHHQHHLQHQGRRTAAAEAEEEDPRRLYRRVEAAGDDGGGMADRAASCGSLYDSTNLLLQYCNNNDDTVSASSALDMEDRVSQLEQRLQLQEDEIQLLKAALADALRRLGRCEEQGPGGAPLGGPLAPGGQRRPLASSSAPAAPLKVRQLLQALPSRPLSNGYVQQKRLLSSPSSPKKDVLQSMKRKSMSTERLTLVKREMGGGESRSRTTSSSSSSGGKSKTKECTLNAGRLRQDVPERASGHHAHPGRSEGQLHPGPQGGSAGPQAQAAVVLNREKRQHKNGLCSPPSTLPYRFPWSPPPPSSPGLSLTPPPSYGYRGRDCRSNLYLLPTGEIVYFNASVVVLYNTEEQQQRHYLGHDDDVKCLSVHPDMVTIATGQVAGNSKDGKVLHPHVRVWDSVSLNTLHVLGAGVFDRAVTCVAFSKSNGGAHLCAVDDANDHILSVWDWQKEKQLAEVKVTTTSDLSPFTVELHNGVIAPTTRCWGPSFHPMDPNLIVTCGKSHINFWTMDGNTLTKKQGLFRGPSEPTMFVYNIKPYKTRNCKKCTTKHEKPKYVLCVAFAENGDAITGDSGGNIYVWAKGGSRISQAVSGAHEGGVFSLCVLKDGTMVSGGGKDRKVVLWDHHYNKQSEMEVRRLQSQVNCISIATVPQWARLSARCELWPRGSQESSFVGTTKNAIIRAAFPDTLTPIVQGHTDELWGLDVHPTMEQFVTCAQDKQVQLWDTNSHQPLWSKAIDDQGRSAGFHPSGGVVAVGTMTGRWLVLDTDTRDLVSMHTDGNEIISNIKYSPDGNYLAVGSHDNFVYIYGVTENGRKYSRAGKCSGHSSFVTHLDWSQDSHYLVTNSGDYEILFWEAPSGKHVTSMDTVRNVEWATYTCPLGFSTFGVWPDGADGTDVNAVCKSHSSSLLASADDFGKVHLFTFPCAQPRAPSHMYGGHSSHVTNIAFLHDDSHLISTGGKDTSILQWVVV
ncbi:Echinoderm microtubule-associated protein-like 1 [Merluccius polli]|uniref:Echinoderm microtubule-associated protein-like 1 n=1 Tax=Merluccius polli TaxID=89951 RepID=A0AA47MBM7_MERPO|nr:Echinoderm microtubule-associated protein-like 1 [Merluccius polli]